jgi:hypothetical protein
MAPRKTERPVYVFETKYFRDCLRIDYESGIRLRRAGVLEPDAEMDDGRPVYLLSPESIQKAQESIRAYRARLSRTRHNLPTVLCPKKTVSA